MEYTPNDFFLERKRTIDATYGRLEKSEENDIEKSEGSRGGKVIGHTKSGKAIYINHNHSDHKEFAHDDHADAAEKHSRISAGSLKADDRLQHSLSANHHWKKAYEKSSIKKSEDDEPTEEDMIKADAEFDLMKSTELLDQPFNLDIIKGEGSRGGKVIGHTKSGKAIYADTNHASHAKFTSQDHLDASDQHMVAFSNRTSPLTAQPADEASAHHYRQYKISKEKEEGGEVIGKTKSGKPVYENHKHSDYHNFNKEDHNDAAKLHEKKAKEHYEKREGVFGRGGDKGQVEKDYDHHGSRARHHTSTSWGHEDAK